ncbi:hypothetical protein IBX73_08960 [candidate division WOR-3 bacterium]|nr:hypothetical protein [candidate division WOR-3 bacterium]
MLNILSAFLINASVFSVGGIGEDVSVFRAPLVSRDNITRIGFALDPEYTLLNQAGEFRGIFWTNPLKLSLAVPVTHGFSLMVGNLERFNQCFDVYLESGALQVHTVGQGGIEEVYGGLKKTLGPVDIMATGSYLFGSAREIWTYSIETYRLVDTFSYRYQGQIFNLGLRHQMFSVFFEGLGEVRKITMPSDTALIDLPERLSIGIYARAGELPFGFVYERSFWNDEVYDSPNRFKAMVSRGGLGLAYYYNPWYLGAVTEHAIDVDFAIPLRDVGAANVKLVFALRSKEGVREMRFVPKLTFVLNEIFARRRK